MFAQAPYGCVFWQVLCHALSLVAFSGTTAPVHCCGWFAAAEQHPCTVQLLLVCQLLIITLSLTYPARKMMRWRSR